MLPPLPRCSSWVYSSLISPRRISLPRFHYRVGLHIVLFEVCSAFTRVAACTLAQVTLVTAIRGLQTFRHLHACPGCFRLERSPGGPCTHLSGALVSSGNFQHRDCIFAEVVTASAWSTGHSWLQQTAASAPGGLGSVIAAQTASTYLRFGRFGTVTIIPHSAGREAGRWDQSGKAAM